MRAGMMIARSKTITVRRRGLAHLGIFMISFDWIDINTEIQNNYMAKKKGAEEKIEPDIKVSFRKPWVIILTLVVAALILATLFYLIG
jgi:1,4-dihydroxy-2-naphthoate octaprenyltransferase